MATPLIDLVRSLTTDVAAAERARVDPRSFLADHGWGDLDDETLVDALRAIAADGDVAAGSVARIAAESLDQGEPVLAGVTRFAPEVIDDAVDRSVVAVAADADDLHDPLAEPVEPLAAAGSPSSERAASGDDRSAESTDTIEGSPLQADVGRDAMPWETAAFPGDEPGASAESGSSIELDHSPGPVDEFD